MQSAKRSVELGKQVFDGLCSLHISPSPECYHVWYEHLSNQNHALSRAIVDKSESNGPINSVFLESLHDQFFGVDNDPKILSALQSIFAKLENIESTAKELRTNTQELNTEATCLTEEAMDESLSLEDIRSVVCKLSHVVTRAVDKSERLEERLSIATQQIGSMKEEIKDIKDKANTDPLTKISNRRRFDSFLSQALLESASSGEPVSLIICDVDHFKKFNDIWGHQIGDQVLQFVASTLRKNAKGRDLVARYGGEEFAVVLPNTKLNGAMSVAEVMRATIAAAKLSKKTTKEPLGVITASFGIAQFDGVMSPADLIQYADDALYQAKRSGRNCVVQASDSGVVATAACA